MAPPRLEPGSFMILVLLLALPTLSRGAPSIARDTDPSERIDSNKVVLRLTERPVLDFFFECVYSQGCEESLCNCLGGSQAVMEPREFRNMSDPNAPSVTISTCVPTATTSRCYHQGECHVRHRRCWGMARKKCRASILSNMCCSTMAYSGCSAQHTVETCGSICYKDGGVEVPAECSAGLRKAEVQGFCAHVASTITGQSCSALLPGMGPVTATPKPCSLGEDPSLTGCSTGSSAAPASRCQRWESCQREYYLCHRAILAPVCSAPALWSVCKLRLDVMQNFVKRAGGPEGGCAESTSRVPALKEACEPTLKTEQGDLRDYSRYEGYLSVSPLTTYPPGTASSRAKEITTTSKKDSNPAIPEWLLISILIISVCCLSFSLSFCCCLLKRNPHLIPGKISRHDSDDEREQPPFPTGLYPATSAVNGATNYPKGTYLDSAQRQMAPALPPIPAQSQMGPINRGIDPIPPYAQQQKKGWKSRLFGSSREGRKERRERERGMRQPYYAPNEGYRTIPHNGQPQGMGGDNNQWEWGGDNGNNGMFQPQIPQPPRPQQHRTLPGQGQPIGTAQGGGMNQQQQPQQGGPQQMQPNFDPAVLGLDGNMGGIAQRVADVHKRMMAEHPKSVRVVSNNQGPDFNNGGGAAPGTPVMPNNNSPLQNNNNFNFNNNLMSPNNNVGGNFGQFGGSPGQGGGGQGLEHNGNALNALGKIGMVPPSFGASPPTMASSQLYPGVAFANGNANSNPNGNNMMVA